MEKGLTKDHSKALYGLAAIFMLIHHLFCIPEKLQGNYFSVTDYLLGDGIEQRLAWFCKICVAIYAFISGYALQRKCLSNTGASALSKNYTVVFKQIIGFLKKYWIVFFIFVPLGLALGKLNDIPLLTFALNAVGLNNPNDYRHICGEWWYVHFYIVMLILFPLLDIVFKTISPPANQNPAKGKPILAAAAILGLSVWFAFLTNTYKVNVMIIVIGYLCGALRIFEVVSTIFRKKLLNCVLALILLIGCFAVRFILCTSAAQNYFDILLVTPFLYAVCVLLDVLPFVKKPLQKLGKYSVYIWLTHTFFLYYYFPEFCTITHNSWLMFVQIFLISLLVAILLSGVEKLVDRGLKALKSHKTATKAKR